MLRAAVVGAHGAHAADQHGHLRRGQAQKLRAVEHQLLRADDVVLLQPVAVAVGERLQHVEAVGVGHLVGGVAAARREGHGDVETGGLRRLLDADIAGQHDHVGDRRAMLRRDRLQHASTLARRSGSLPSQSFCGARRMRAPLAPPRMSEPRIGPGAVPGGGDHVGDRQAGGGDLRLDRADVVAGRAGRDRILPDQVFLRARPGRCSGPSGPCRGGSA
jgi:hypothetical protein